MSLARTEKIACPGCSKEQEVTIHSSINRNLDPELLVKLFEDGINVLVCSSCHKSHFIDVPLMYHDMDRKYAISYYPTRKLKEDDFYEQFTPDGKLRFEFPDNLSDYVDGQKANYLKEAHIVFDMEEMKRYIFFRTQLSKLSDSELDR